MHVHEPALLVLGDLHVRRAHEALESLLRDAEPASELARQVDRGPPPQLAEQVVPQQRARVVEALAAQRLAQARIVLGVHARARERVAVRADRRVAAGPAAPRPPVRSEHASVNRPEARRRQRGEDHRVLGDAVRHALAAAHPGGDQVVGVLAVALGARGTDRLAPVPARLPEHAVGLVARRPHRMPAPVRAAGLHVSLQPDRPGAVAG